MNTAHKQEGSSSIVIVMKIFIAVLLIIALILFLGYLVWAGAAGFGLYFL